MASPQLTQPERNAATMAFRRSFTLVAPGRILGAVTGGFD